jgi:hypothetical protein
MGCLKERFQGNCFHQNSHGGTLIDRMSGIGIAAMTSTAAIVIVQVAEALDAFQRKIILITIGHDS